MKPMTTVEEALDTSPELEGARQGVQAQRLATVLLIEDDRDLSRALTLRLQRAGLTVARAYDGPTGLEKVRFLEPSVIILDLGLPRMDGGKFLHFLRMAPRIPVPIIVITGSTNASLLHKAEHWGVNRLLRKPLSPKALVEATLEVLQGL